MARWRVVCWASMAVALMAALAGCGVEQGALLETPEGRKVLERARDERQQEQRLSEVGDAAIEQGQELSPGATLPPEAEACIQSGMEAAGIDMLTVIGDPGAVDAQVTFMEVLFGCIDDPATDPFLIPLMSAALSTIVPGVELSDDETSCLVRHVMDESPEPARTLVNPDDGEDTAILEAGFDACLSEEDLAILDGTEGVGPQTYGDDERLDGMYDDCDRGNDRACDLLYRVAGAGSDYEEFGQTCGGRSTDLGRFCSPEAVTDDTGFSPADNPGLTVLADDCRAGDNTACDLLGALSPTASEGAEVARSCGGRIVAAIPDCRTRFGR